MSWYFSKGASAPAYDLFEERCEGTGTPASWTDTGSPNWDNASSPIAGAQSLTLGSASDTVEYSVGTRSEIWVHFAATWSAIPTAHTAIISLRESGVTRAYFSLRTTTGAIRVYNTASTNDSLSFTPTAGTTYYFWWRYKTGSGADGISQLYASTDPTARGALNINNTTTPATASIDSVLFSGGPTMTLKLDNLIASTTEILASP